MEVPPPAPRPSRRRARWLPCWIAAAVLAAAYGGLAAFHVAYGAMNVDEGFYAAATRAVWQGEMPYRDFGYPQTPLVPYANAVPLGLVRFGLFEQRAVNGAWGALALLLAAWLVARRAGRGWALFVLALFTVSPAWMYFIHLGKTYGVTTFVALAATAVFLEARAGWKKSVVLSVLCTIGVGCRLPSVPFFAVLWLAALWHGGRPAARPLALAGGSLAAAATLLLPFYLAAPEAARFWVFDLHRASLLERDWQLGWTDYATLAPALAALALCALGSVIAQRRWRQREVAVLLAAALALAANLLPPGVYEEYGVPFLPPLAVAAARLWLPTLSGASPLRKSAIASVLLVAPLALIPALNWRQLAPEQRTFPSCWLPRNAPPYNYALPAHLRLARDTVRRLLPVGEPFIGSSVIVAIEADRPVPRKLRMDAFTMTADFPAAQADRLHLMTFAEFEKLLRDIDVTVLGFHSRTRFNFAWSMPSFDYQSPEERQQWMRLVERYFVPVTSDDDFAVLARPHILPLVPR